MPPQPDDASTPRDAGDAIAAVEAALALVIPPPCRPGVIGNMALLGEHWARLRDADPASGGGA